MYFIDPNLGYVRLLMFSEYEDMIFLSHRLIDFFFWPFKAGLTKYIFKKVIGMFLTLTIYILLLSHMTACIFIFTERRAQERSTDQTAVNRYISVLYFMVTTSTTVGYGDITIDHSSRLLIFVRYAYQVFLMLMTLLLNSVFYSLINMTVKDAVYMMDKMYEPLEEFDLWQAARIREMGPHPNINKFYKQNNMNFNFSYNFSLDIWVCYLEFIEKVPFEWREKIVSNVCQDL